jgi:hypothetical protein
MEKGKIEDFTKAKIRVRSHETKDRSGSFAIKSLTTRAREICTKSFTCHSLVVHLSKIINDNFLSSYASRF